MDVIPAWLDDPALVVSLAAVRAALAHHAATEVAEGRTPAEATTLGKAKRKDAPKPLFEEPHHAATI